MYFRVSNQVLFISKTFQYFHVLSRYLVTVIASGSVCSRNLFPFKVLNYKLYQPFSTFYFILHCIFVLDVAALQLLVAQYRRFF